MLLCCIDKRTNHYSKEAYGVRGFSSAFTTTTTTTAKRVETETSSVIPLFHTREKSHFLAAARNGRIYFDVCCHGKLYENQVLELDNEWKESMEEQYPASIQKYIGTIPHPNNYLPTMTTSQPQLLHANYVCHTCKRY